MKSLKMTVISTLASAALMTAMTGFADESANTSAAGTPNQMMPNTNLQGG